MDPAATGLMVVGIGKATRFLQFYEGESKSYQFDIVPGIVTDSYDREGTVLQEVSLDQLNPPLTEDAVQEKIKNFIGVQEQMPPIYSAIKIQGKRACDRVRSGEQISLQARTVCVHRFDLIHFSKDRLSVEVDCSKGTYVRSLAHDLGQQLGCGAIAENIRRTAVGRFSLQSALSPDDVHIDTPLLPIHEALGHLPAYILETQQIQSFLHGREVRLQNTPNPSDSGSLEFTPVKSGHELLVCVLSPKKKFLGLAELHTGQILKPKIVLG